jgi:TRAP-type uncharacterized transport system substrate-binding protein
MDMKTSSGAVPTKSQQKPTISLRFSSCWGITNFTRVAGWILWGLRDHYDIKSKFTIELGNGVMDNFQRLGRKQVELSIITPPSNMGLAMAGKGPFTEAYPDLVVLGRMEHDDRMACGVAKHVQINSLREIAERKLPLRIGADLEDVGASLAFASREILNYYGLTEESLASWGGELVHLERGPRQGVNKILAGELDIILHEAVMLDCWYELITKQGGKFVSFDDELLTQLSEKWGYQAGDIPAGYGDKANGIRCIDWADWLVIGRKDMDHDLAYHVAQVMAEKKRTIELQYERIPLQNSPMVYPIDVDKMFDVPDLPYHPGALAFYADWKARNGRI